MAGGSKKIFLNDVMLKVTLSGLRTSKNSLNTSVSKLPKVSSCSGIKISEYEKKGREIASLLEEYKKLLAKDIEDVEKIRQSIAQTDKDISVMFKNVK